MTNTEKLSLFFNQLKSLSFWQRLFSWRTIQKLSYDAYEEYKSLLHHSEHINQEIEQIRQKINLNINELKNLEDKIKEHQNREISFSHELDALKNKREDYIRENRILSNKLTTYETEEKSKNEEYSHKISELNVLKKSLEEQAQKIQDERLTEQENEWIKMKKMWADHEYEVQQKIKMLCKKHLINYVENPPFKGKPDNIIEICNEYVIFDAKSPANDDLTNFPKYLKTQTEGVKKYAQQKEVKKDLFLVVPTNTINTVKEHSYNMGEYSVFIITLDALEPIILSLKKIEDYEFAEQLSPDERNHICRIIGKFAHTTKRKIQIDQFFADQFIELLVKCKKELPEPILKSVIDFENAEKLNPPTEKRTKQILTEKLKEKHQSINTEANIRSIQIPKSFDDLKKLN